MEFEPLIEKRPSKALITAVRIIAWTSSKVFWRIKFHGTENIPSPEFGGFIIAANHQTYIDPIWISIPIYHDIRYMAWDQVFGWPILGRVIPKLGAVPVNLDRHSPLRTLRLSLKLLRAGSALMIFPEGQREYSDGEILPFKEGVVQLAKKAGVPILPVTITGANMVWPREYRIPRPGKVSIYFHPLMYVDSTQESGKRELSINEIRLRLENKIRDPM